MVHSIGEGNIVLKVSANREEDVLKFCKELQKIYKLVLIGRLIPSEGGGCHCYIDLVIDSMVQ
jgi:hypothetical protein